MQMSGALAAYQADGEADAPRMEGERRDDAAAEGPVLGAPWLAAFQEMLLWPFALAAAFAWIVQL